MLHSCAKNLIVWLPTDVLLSPHGVLLSAQLRQLSPLNYCMLSWILAAALDSDLCTSAVGISEQQLLAISQQMSEITLTHRQCLQALDMQQPERARSLALSGLKLADCMPATFKALGKLHIWRMRLHEGRVRSYISLGTEWESALSVAQKLVPVYELVYPKVSGYVQTLVVVTL